MPDWHGTTGRDDLVGGGTSHQTIIDGITLCTDEPFTDEEVAALRKYFALLRDKRLVVTDADLEDYPGIRRGVSSD